MAIIGTRVEIIPSFFEMPCIACSVRGTNTAATHTVVSQQGVGLASCEQDIDRTGEVVLSVPVIQLVEIRQLFSASNGA